MLRTVPGQHIKAARAKAARLRQSVRIDAPVPCAALELGSVQTEGLSRDQLEDRYAQRAWEYISARDSQGALLRELRDPFTLELLVDNYVPDDNWQQLLWYWHPDGTRRIAPLPDGWATGPSSIMRVAPLCTAENGQKFTEYARKAVVLAYFASQRKERPQAQNGRLYPDAYQVPGATGRDIMIPVLEDDNEPPPEYDEALFLMNRFLDECKGYFVNPDAPEDARIPLYDRERDAPVPMLEGDKVVLVQPLSPFSSSLNALRSNDAQRAQLAVNILAAAMQAMEGSPVNSEAQITNLTDALSDIRTYWKDDEIRHHLVNAQWERFRDLIGSRLHDIFTNGDRPAFQGKIVDFWHGITGGSDWRAVDLVLSELRSAFSVTKDSPLHTWFHLAPLHQLLDFDYDRDRKTRTLEFVSDMLWDIRRPRPVVSEFDPVNNTLSEAMRSQYNSLLEDINTVVALTQVFVDALKAPGGVPPQEEADRLIAVLVRARGVLREATFENLDIKLVYTRRLFMAALDAWVAAKRQPFGGVYRSPPDSIVDVLRAFNITMQTVVEVVDLDRPGGLFEPANSRSLERYFWTVVVPLSPSVLWDQFNDPTRRSVIAKVIRQQSIAWGPPPEQLSLPPGEPMEEEEEEGPTVVDVEEDEDGETPGDGMGPSDTEAFDTMNMERLVGSISFLPFPSTLSAYQAEAFNAFTTRIDIVEQQFRRLTWADRMWEIDTVDGLVPNLEALGNDFETMTFPSAFMLLKNALQIVNNVLILNEMGAPYTEREQEQVRAAFRETFHAIVNRVNDMTTLPSDYPHFMFLNSVVQKAQGLSYVPDADAVALALVRHLPATEPAVEATTPSSSDSEEDDRSPVRLRRVRSQNDNRRAVRQRTTSARYARTLAERLAATRLSRRG